MTKSSTRIACIVLAAGKSERFVKTKQLATVKGIPMLQRAIDAANRSLADYVLLIVGSKSSEILSRIDTGRTQVILNKSYERGQSTSVKCGISNIPDDCSGTIMMVADQPFLSYTHLNKMIRAFSRNSSETIILSHEGKPRNPVLIPKALFPLLMKLRGDRGAKAVARRSKKVRLIEISDEKVFFDVDTKRDYSKVVRES